VTHAGVEQTERPDKTIYSITPAGRDAPGYLSSPASRRDHPFVATPSTCIATRTTLQ
jgi:hypothetical protein